jgi:hypothetical protein
MMEAISPHDWKVIFYCLIALWVILYLWDTFNAIND